jgi:hypothetical protein
MGAPESLRRGDTFRQGENEGPRAVVLAERVPHAGHVLENAGERRSARHDDREPQCFELLVRGAIGPVPRDDDEIRSERDDALEIRRKPSDARFSGRFREIVREIRNTDDARRGPESEQNFGR